MPRLGKMGKMGKREIAAKFLGSRMARPLPGPRGSALRILAYHRVLDDDPRRFPYDEGVISCTTEAFERQVAFAAKNFDVISFAELYKIECEGRRPPKRPLIITFDDGYRDNYTNAFPILKQAGLTATIFLAAGYIQAPKLFWWDLVAYCVKQTALSDIALPGISAAPLCLSSAGDKPRAIEMILGWIKQAPDKVKNQFVESLPVRLGVRVPKPDQARLQVTWEEVRLMAANNIEFGSHTMTHPILSNVCADQLRTEVAGSKAVIEEQLGKEVIAFAYPVGGRRHFNNHVRAAVAGSGYKYAVSYLNGVASLDRILPVRPPVHVSPPEPVRSASDPSLFSGSDERFSMARIHVEFGDSFSLFRANLMFPQLMLGG